MATVRMSNELLKQLCEQFVKDLLFLKKKR